MRVDRRAHHPERVGSENPSEDGADEGEEYDELIHDAASALHEIDVFDRDGAAVAEVDDEDGEPDRCFGGGDGQDEKRENLPHQIVEEGREGDKVDVDREQHELDRHQDDDDVLAVEEDAEYADGEEDGGDGEKMSKRDVHLQI